MIISLIVNQVEHEFIYYVHDSSETLADNFTVVANDTGLRKQSAAQTVYIEVTAVNDEPPVIIANRVLRVSRHRSSIFKLWTLFFFNFEVWHHSLLSKDFHGGGVTSCHDWSAHYMRETMFGMWRVQRTAITQQTPPYIRRCHPHREACYGA